MINATLTLNSPITEEQWDKITDVNLDNSEYICFHTKNGKQVEYKKQKKGKWIEYMDCEGKSRRITCDQCGHEEWNWLDPNFCSNCGADMRGVRRMNVESVNAVIDDMVKEIRYLEDKLAEREWIPCSERLPDKDGDYLITYDESYANDNDYDRLVSIAPFEVESEAFGYWHQCLGTNGWLGEDWISIPVVAWMPIPPSYKGDET